MSTIHRYDCQYRRFTDNVTFRRIPFGLWSQAHQMASRVALGRLLKNAYGFTVRQRRQIMGGQSGPPRICQSRGNCLFKCDLFGPSDFCILETSGEHGRSMIAIDVPFCSFML